MLSGQLLTSASTALSRCGGWGREAQEVVREQREELQAEAEADAMAEAAEEAWTKENVDPSYARFIADFWKERAEMLKATGDLSENDYQILAFAARNIGREQGQIQADYLLSRYDVYYLLTQAPLGKDLNRLWITGLFRMFTDAVYESIWYNDLLDLSTFQEDVLEKDKLFPIFGEKSKILFHHYRNEVIGFGQWRKAVKCLKRLAKR